MMRTFRTIAKRTIRAHKGLCLMSVMGLLGLMGCSSDQNDELAEEPTAPVFNQTTPISFSNDLPMDSTVTRAGLETIYQNFKVWGYKNDVSSYQTVFPGFTVNYGASTAHTTTSNTHNWEYVGVTAEQTIKYWDWGAVAYRFFAVAPATAVTPSIGDTEATATATVDVSTNEGVATAPYFSDLWYSTGSAVNYPDKQFGEPVMLTFRKPYARVRFLFIYVDGLVFGREKIFEPQFKPLSDATIITKGAVTVAYPLKGASTEAIWSMSPTSPEVGIDKFDIDYYETPVPAITPADDGATTWPNTPQKWFVVLPQSLGDFQMSVQVFTDEVKTVTVPAAYMNWKAGYEYTYKFKVTKSGDVQLQLVQVGINNWSSELNVDHDVYNW